MKLTNFQWNNIPNKYNSHFIGYSTKVSNYIVKIYFVGFCNKKYAGTSIEQMLQISRSEFIDELNLILYDSNDKVLSFDNLAQLVKSLDVPHVNKRNIYSASVPLIGSVSEEIVCAFLEKLFLDMQTKPLNIRQEKPCKSCGKNNDLGINECWWCGNNPF